MKTLTKWIFFVVFYVLMGTAGITIPLLYDFNACDFATGLITIVVSIVCYSCGELLLKSNLKKFEKIIYISAICLALFSALFVVKYANDNNKIASLVWSSILYLLSCILWWYQKRDSDLFDDATASMGGEIEP